MLNILLVEDDKVDVMNVQRAFDKAGITDPVYLASHGVQALEMLRSGEVPAHRRLVLLDLNLPQMNGIELLRVIRTDPALRTLNVVVLTTSNEERDRADAYSLNVAGYLLKPAVFSDFVNLVRVLHAYWSRVEV